MRRDDFTTGPDARPAPRQARMGGRALAWRSRAKAGPRKYGDDAKEYAREAKKLPMRIMAAGLGQALSFLLAEAKEKKPNLRRLHEHLTDWVIRKRPIAAAGRIASWRASSRATRTSSAAPPTRPLAYLQWLNRFAEAEGLTEDETGD